MVAKALLYHSDILFTFASSDEFLYPRVEIANLRQPVNERFGRRGYGALLEDVCKFQEERVWGESDTPGPQQKQVPQECRGLHLRNARISQRSPAKDKGRLGAVDLQVDGGILTTNQTLAGT